MGSMLPEPPSDKGKIYENTKEKLWIEAYKVSEKQYSDYIIACEAKGFNVDAENEDYTYEAYDKYVVNPDDVSCTSQLTNGKKEITLITCKNFGTQRLIIKCREI